MVRKLEKRGTVTCYLCHKKGHKSYECKNKKKGEENKKKFNSNTKPYLKVDKNKSTPYLLKEKDNKVVAQSINKARQGVEPTYLGAQGNHNFREGLHESLRSKGDLESQGLGRIWRLGYTRRAIQAKAKYTKSWSKLKIIHLSNIQILHK